MLARNFVYESNQPYACNINKTKNQNKQTKIKIIFQTLKVLAKEQQDLC